MKKFLFLMCSLLAFAGNTVKADDHWTYTAGKYNKETFVYANFVRDGELIYSGEILSNYEFAAFIDGELRGKAELKPNSSTPTQTLILRFRVEGEVADIGKTITFKAFYTPDEVEYSLTVDESLPTFTGETTDIPSNPLQLKLTQPESITIDDIILNVNEEATPLNYVKVTPASASIPTNIQWAYGAEAENYYSFKNNATTIKAIAPTTPTTNGASIWASVGGMTAEGKVYIYQPATTFTRTQAEITVDVDDIVTNELGSCYTLAPDNTTDHVVWTSANEEIVGPSEKEGVLLALSAGDVVLTGTVYDNNNNIRTGIAPITVTVHVRQGVTSITTPFTGGGDWPKYLECSVGDNLKDYFVNGKSFNVLPGNAYDKNVTLTPGERADDYVSIDNQGNINVIKEGEFYILVTSENNPNATVEVWVNVHNEVRDVTVNKEELEVRLTDGQKDISELVKQNLSILPSTASVFNDAGDCGVEVSSSDDDVVIVEDGYCFTNVNYPFLVTAKKAGTATITMEFYTKDYLAETFGFQQRWGGTVKKTFNVVVTQAVTGITTAFMPTGAEDIDKALDCMPGDDLTPYFVDGKVFTILPADASNKKVKVEYLVAEANERGVTIDADGNITAVGATVTSGVPSELLKITSVDNPEVYCIMQVFVHNDIKTLTARQAEYNVNFEGTDVNIDDIVADPIAFGPEGAYTFYEGTDFENMIVSSEPSVVEVTDKGLVAKSVGTARITMTIKWKDYLKAEFDASQTYEYPASAFFDVIVSQGLTGLEVAFVKADPSAGNYNDKLVVTPVPAGAPMDIDKLEGSFTYVGSEVWSNSVYGDLNFTLNDFIEDAANNTAEAVFYEYNNIPGKLVFKVTYDDGTADGITATTDPQEIGYLFGVNGGWEWRTIPYGSFNDLHDVFANDLIEIRTQNGQVYNDPEYGFFGDLDLLAQNVCFKLKTQSTTGQGAQTEVPEYVNSTRTVLYGGTLGTNSTITLRKGWNWIPNPYVFKRYITRLGGTFVEGDRIVSKSNGFAEYDGSYWDGYLDLFYPGQGYLFFNAGNAGRTLTFENELEMEFNDDDYVERARSASAPKASLYQYDASRFRDNMTIVAQLADVVDADHYQAYAFVGDECRGEGASINGKLFITVHANAGEQITFRLYNELTGELYDAENTVTMQQMLGTLAHPFQMTVNDIATGISNNQRSSQGNAEYYDLGGRRVNDSKKGVLLQRHADGTVHKSVKN